MKKQVAIYVGIVVLLIGLIAGGFYLYQSGMIFAQPAPTPIAAKVCPTSDAGKTITYSGKDGATALDLLNQTCDTVTSGTGTSAFITGINGITANASNEFWSFEVNGEMAAVGAGSYTTKNSDTIVWKLSSF